MKVFLAAPQGIDIEPIVNAVRSADWDVVGHDHVTILSQPIVGALETQLSRADAVIALGGVTEGLRNEYVLLEAGAALGLGKPLLVIYEEGILPSLSPSESVSVAQINLRNRDALQFHIHAFLAGVASGRRESRSRTIDKISSREVSRLRTSLADLRIGSAHSGERFTQWIATVFQAGGIKTLQSEIIDRGFDMVANVPANTWPFRPILIVAKLSNTHPPFERESFRLQSIVESERAGLGLVVWHALARPVEPTNLPLVRRALGAPSVLVVPAQQLMSKLEHLGSMSSVLEELRIESLLG